MKALLGISVVLNLALLGWLVVKINSDDRLVPSVAVTESRQKLPKEAVMRVPGERPPPPQWSSLESMDFLQYIANLRAFGCPEETIRDLIMAEVNKLYAPKFMALAEKTASITYWKNRSSRSNPEYRTAFTTLAEEKKALLFNLLGLHYDPSEHWANLSADKLLEIGRYAFLGADKQKALLDIVQKFGLRDGQSWPNEMRQEIASLLTPAEMEELELRDSSTAN